MKKTLYLLMAALTLFAVTGCEKVEKKYKEGVYEADVVDDYNNEGNIASARVVINAEGNIESIYLDTTYTTKDGVQTTKKDLQVGYGMKKGNSPYGVADLEWFEQVEQLENAIVENNGIDFITLKEDNTTDAVSGCTIRVDALVAATQKALEQAK